MNYIDEIISILETTSKDHIMVHKDLLFVLLSIDKEESIRQKINLVWGEFVPDPNDLVIDDKWFRSKTSLICRKLEISQSTLATESGINQGDLSKFEAGLKEFGPQRKEKIISALRSLKNKAQTKNQSPRD